MLRARLSIAHLLDANPRMPEKWPRLARVYLKLAAADASRLERILGDRLKKGLNSTGRRATKSS